MDYKLKVCPSLLAADYGYLADAAIAAEKAGADSLHLDYMDGHYVPNISFGIDLIPALRKRVKIPLIAHLMISNTVERLPDFIKVAPDCIVIQEDTVEDLAVPIGRIRKAGIKPGLAVTPPRPLDKIRDALGSIGYLLILGVNPGFGGQSFMEETLPKMEEAHRFRVKNGLSWDIAVDGGVNKKTAPRIVKTGANVLVAGTAVFGAADIGKAVAEFLAME
jgi:ribulose-phosphate 3-epimerase